MASENTDHFPPWQELDGAAQRPGGAHGAPMDVGMSGIDPEAVPSQEDHDKPDPEQHAPEH